MRKRKIIVCWDCKKKKPHHARELCRACYGRMTRALRGGIPRWKCRGHLASNWSGGEMMDCAVEGCHRRAGWKTPSSTAQSYYPNTT